jgi:undecaprenyl-diphosphatase
LLASSLVITALTLVFGVIAEEAMEGDTNAFDRRGLLLFRSTANPAQLLGPPWLAEGLRDLSSLGSVVVLSLIVTTVLGYLALTRNRIAFVSILGAVLTGQVLSTGLKDLFERARPDLIPGAPHVFTTSFPSGHATLSAVTYLTLGAMMARLEPRRGVKVFLMASAFTLTALVGVSRVALGVHWPTDVFAGWCIGCAWALLCMIIAQHFTSQHVPTFHETSEDR